MASPVSLPTKCSALFVSFAYGPNDARVVERFTDWFSPREHNGFIYEPAEGIEVKPVRKTGTLSEQPVTVTMKLAIDDDTGEPADPDSFLALVSNGEPFPLTSVEIDEVTFEAGSSDVVALHRGLLSITRRNYQGRPDLVQLESESWKSRLKAPLGIPITHLCPWRFGGKGCFLPGGLDPLRETGTIDAIDGATVTISGLATHTAKRYWHRGYVDVDGLVIDVREWDRDEHPDRFKLVKFAPARWLGATVTVTPGCTKTKSRCAAWDNLPHFGGIGIKMPNRNPILESGGNT